MKMINFLIQKKKKRVNKKLYLIQSDFLNLSRKKRIKIRKSILKIDNCYWNYSNDNTVFSKSDYIFFEKKLKKMISRIFYS